MRILPAFTLTILAATLAACERSTEPVVASVGGQAALASSGALVISPSQVSIDVGATAQLSTNAPASQQSQLRWFSSNNSVATVTQSGLVTSYLPGSITITARFAFDTTRVATAIVNVGQ